MSTGRLAGDLRGVQVVHGVHVVDARAGAARTSSRSRPRGALSSSTSVVSRSRCIVRGRISSPIRMETTASARSQPVVAMTSGGDQDRDRAERVVDDLEERGPHVEVAAARRGPARRIASRLPARPDGAEDEHRRGDDLGRRRPAGGRPPPGRRRRRRAGRPPAGWPRAPRRAGSPRCAGRGRPGGERGGEVRDQQAGGVGEHVPGVGEQRQAAGQRRADDLGDEHRAGDEQHQQQSPPVVGRPVVVLTPAHRRVRAGSGAGGQDRSSSTVSTTSSRSVSACARCRSVSS